MRKIIITLIVLFHTISSRTQTFVSVDSANSLKNINTHSTYVGFDLSEIIGPPGYQLLSYKVRKRYPHLITKEQLQSAKRISDLDWGYPASWVSDYISVEILTSCNGKEITTVGLNDTLTVEQKNMFSSVDVASDMAIKVRYSTKNSITGQIENRKIEMSMTIVPEIAETDAEYVGGYGQMINDLRGGSINEILDKNLKRFQPSSVVFRVNADGEVDHVALTSTSGDAEIDQLLVERVRKMPKWKPAKNAQGAAINQKFILNVNRASEEGC